MNRLRYNLYRCLFATNIIFSLIGCKDDVLPNEVQGGMETSMKEECIFNAYIKENPDTRTGMGDLDGNRYQVLWSEGDKVVAFDMRNKKYDATLMDGAGTNKAVFKGKYWDNTQHLTSIYPSEGAEFKSKNHAVTNQPDGSSYYLREITATAVLPSTQIYQNETFANNVFPMIGHCFNQYDFYYENIGGILQLPVKGEGTISKIVLTGNNGEVLAGKFTVEFDYWYWKNRPEGVTEPVTIDYLEKEIAESEKEACNGRKILAVDGSSTGIITIDCGKNGLKLSPDKVTMVNIVMLPKTFVKGFTVRFIDQENGGSFVKMTSMPIIVKRSYVKTMQEFDYQKPEPLEPANCHVVDKVGYYMIPAFCMGNRPKSARFDVNEYGIYGKTGNPVAADFLWTDVSGAITDIEYIPGKDGYISFKVNSNSDGTSPKGNTVIALYDSVTKEILWSWHIWMSDFKEIRTNGSCRGGEDTADGFKSDQATGNMIIMDRNLGATSADPNDGWKTYGLYYQMGRKDPFIGAKFNGGDAEDIYYNNIHHDKDGIKEYYQYEAYPFGTYTNETEWNRALSPSGWSYETTFITAVYGYQHPMTYASSWNKDNDTRWTNEKINTTYPFISNGEHEDYWNRSKTVNDPCPAGWTIIGKYGQYFDTRSSTINHFHSGNSYGLEVICYVNGTDYTSWWPAAGFRSVDGTMGNVGDGGYYWWFDHLAADHGGHGWMFDTYKSDKYPGLYTRIKEDIHTNQACVIRCVKAKQTE